MIMIKIHAMEMVYVTTKLGYVRVTLMGNQTGTTVKTNQR